jgi:hypothetical protein
VQAEREVEKMKTIFVMFMALVLVLAPAMAIAQNYSSGGQAPIAQPLVREGTLAVRLVEAFRLGTTTDEVEAENLLLSVGIGPRDGWISDYPVTPDIVSELRESVIDAADAGSLKLGRDEAAFAFDGVLAQYNLMVKTEASAGEAVGEQAPGYPDDTMAEEYYNDYGPPPVTYYDPPVGYEHLYSWVPYPFWGWNAWFPGFFVLADFHRFVFVDKRVCVVSNHFFDKRKHRYSRVDARARFREFHDRRFGNDREHRKNFANKRVVGPSEVRGDVERRVRLDADRSRTNFSSGREMRRETRQVKREDRKFNFSGRREGSVVAPPEKSRNSSRPAERRFRPSAERGGHREFNSAPRSINSSRVLAPSAGGRAISRPVSQRGFSPSFGGARGGGKSSFGGFGGRNRR